MNIEICKDSQSASQCQEWKDKGICKFNYARIDCQITCGVCGK